MDTAEGGHCRCGPFRVNMMPQGMLKPYVLFLLSRKPMHGLEIMEEISRRSNGVWKSGPAAVYPSLKWLRVRGYIEPSGKAAAGEKSRRQYRIAAKGRDAMKGYRNFEKEWFGNLRRLRNLFD